MYIKNIKLKNYRNYDEISVDLDKNINIIYGNNAEGKTNFLESIYLCSTSKTFRNCKEKEIIKFGKEDAHIKIILYKENVIKKENAIDIQLNKEIKKGIALNGLKIEKMSEYLGFFSVIIFSPEDLNIIKEGPNLRRKFLDMAICQIDKTYILCLNNYNKTLNQRNAILRDLSDTYGGNKDVLENMIEIYDEQLVKYGSQVIEKRKKNIVDLAEKIEKIYKKIVGEKEQIKIEYENDLNTDINNYKKKLEETKEIDKKNKYTFIGPHRDDIKFSLDGIDLRKFGSQGQKKTAAISLKLAELYLIKEKINETPVLLLDDVFSELDETRQKLLVSNLEGVQTIITCTGIKKNIFDLLNPNKIFQVKNGSIKNIR